jgi:hypothetical protein
MPIGWNLRAPRRIKFNEIAERFVALSKYAARLPVSNIDGPHCLNSSACAKAWPPDSITHKLIQEFQERIYRYDGRYQQGYNVPVTACAKLTILPGEGSQLMHIKLAIYPARIPTPGRRAHWGRGHTYDTAITYMNAWRGGGNIIIEGAELPRRGGIVNYVKAHYCAVKILDVLEGFNWTLGYRGGDAFDSTEFMLNRDFESLISQYVKVEGRHLDDLLVRFTDVHPWDVPEICKLRQKLQPGNRRRSRGVKIRQSSQQLTVR